MPCIVKETRLSAELEVMELSRMGWWDWNGSAAKYWYVYFNSGQAYGLEGRVDDKGNVLKAEKPGRVDGEGMDLDAVRAWL